MDAEYSFPKYDDFKARLKDEIDKAEGAFVLLYEEPDKKGVKINFINRKENACPTTKYFDSGLAGFQTIFEEWLKQCDDGSVFEIVQKENDPRRTEPAGSRLDA